MNALGLRARVLLLLGVAVLPAVALLWIGRAPERGATARALSLAHLTGQAQAQRLDVARQLLIALSTHPEMRGSDLAACHRLVRLLQSQYETIYATIGRATADGTVDCLELDGATPGMSI